jgi:hypothetical protein
MADCGVAPRALIVLTVGGREVPLGRVEATTACDLSLVDDLLRLQLAAKRLALSVALSCVDDDLRDLLDLLGLADALTA